MSSMTGQESLANLKVNLESPTCLFESDGHAIYWLGILEETAFRCNAYLIKDGETCILVDPGGVNHFEHVKKRVKQITPINTLTGIIVCHQDPDVAGSLALWLKLLPKLTIYTTARTNVLLPHYGISDYDFYDVAEKQELELPSGKKLKFIQSPFLHFPGAFATYDESAQYLFSGDIWAALDINWKLVIDDFAAHQTSMNLFNIEYMASNLACRGFIKQIENLKIDAILPQHGSIITQKHVTQAIDYLRHLECGTDIIYADIEES
jgi:flavorubredoxin